jgi:hypothetical protein
MHAAEMDFPPVTSKFKTEFRVEAGHSIDWVIICSFGWGDDGELGEKISDSLLSVRNRHGSSE